MGRVRNAGRLAVDQPQFSMQTRLANWNANQFAASQFVSTLISGRRATLLPTATKPLNGLQSGQFDVHVRRSVTLENVCLVA